MGDNTNRKQLLLFALSGILLGLSVNTLGSIPLSPLAWIAFIPMFFALKESVSWQMHLVATYLFSSIKLTLGLFSFVTVSVLPGLGLIFFGAFIYSIPLWIHYFLQRKVGWEKALYVLPFTWTAFIGAVSDGLLAMPILSFSPSQAALPWLIQYIDITGQTAIIFWLLLLNVLLTVAIDSWKEHKSKLNSASEYYRTLAKRIILIISAMFLPPLLYSLVVFQTLPSTYTGEIEVGLVQPGFTNDGTEDGTEFVNRLFLTSISLTDSLTANHEVDLVIWPETAILVPFLEDPNAVQAIFQKVLQWETPLLTGTIDRGFFAPGETVPNLQKYLGRNYTLYNSAMMVTPQLAWMHLQENLPLTSVKMYHKTHLMPFTEYVPLSETFPVLSNLSFFTGEFSHFNKGNSLEYLTFAAQNQIVHKVSPMICWDILSSRSSKLAVDTGSQFIAALTNESALGDQFRVTVYEMESYTRLRSIESRRSIAKASLTGYTFFTDPFGQVYGLVPWWSPQISVVSVILTDYQSIYSRYPNAYVIFNLLGLAFILFRVTRVPKNKSRSKK
jgi:apolipoprotein N-acyltransferase